MSAWQFKFILVPRVAIEELHGKDVEVLPEYVSRSPNSDFDESREFPNYWRRLGIPCWLSERVERLIPRAKSWSSDAQMFGDTNGNNVEIWSDDVICNIDVRDPNMPLLAQMIQVANELDCKLILKGSGKIIDAELKAVEDSMVSSNAMKFVRNPEAYIRQRSNGGKTGVEVE